MGWQCELLKTADKLSIDPLAALPETREQLHQRLREITPTDSAELEAAWRTEADAVLTTQPASEVGVGPKQFLVLVTWRDEPQQVELFRRLSGEGLQCRALLP